MDIKFDTVDFQAVFTAAIVQALDQQKKDELLKGAVASLFEKENSYGYGDKKTKLVAIFQQAMHEVARDYIKDYIKTDPQVKESIESLIRDAVVKINGEAQGQNNHQDCRKNN